jgi:hypothetical protein
MFQSHQEATMLTTPRLARLKTGITLRSFARLNQLDEATLARRARHSARAAALAPAVGHRPATRRGRHLRCARLPKVG